MRILEVRDGFIKFESNEKISLSDFVRINDFEKSYIAQVIQVNNAGSTYNIYAKLIGLYNGSVTAYDRTMPSKDAEIDLFDFNKVVSSFEVKMPLIPFETPDGNKIRLDKDFLDSLLISFDEPKTLKTFADNISKQVQNVVIIDFRGNIGSDKFVAGRDFKLPLNSSSLEFMYEDCLNDATSDSKNLVKDIFKDLAEYSKTVPFVPFGALKTIVDDMVDKSHIFKLLVLKNKLAKFEKLGYFAANESEVKKLDEILGSKNYVIDLSKLDSAFQNRYFEIIFSMLAKSENKPVLIVNASNTLNKKNLKTIVQDTAIRPVLAVHSKFQFLNDIKTMFKNFLIEPSFANFETFKIYKSLLSSLTGENALFIGETSNRLPLVCSIREVDIEQTETAEEETKETAENLEAETEISIEQEESQPETELTEEQKAINEKEEKLIEGYAEDLETPSIDRETNLFDDEDTESFAQETDFHTNIDDTRTLEVPDEIIDMEEEENSEQEESNDDETVVLTEDTLIDEELPVSEETFAEPEEIRETEVTETVIEPETEPEEEIQDILMPDETLIETEPEEIPEYDNVIPQSEEEIIPETENDEFQELDLDDDSEFDEIVELDESEITDDTPVIDITDESEKEEITKEEELDREINEDVDKVFTTIKDDTISDEDLDFIDVLNEENELGEETPEEEIPLGDGMEELIELEDDNTEEGFLEPLEEINDEIPTEVETKDKEILETKSSTTPIVPVYDADIPQEDLVQSDPIEQGDTVVHAKYGTGVVEKMIKYGTKDLYSINFDNVGRRLLDPTLTELKKA